MTVHSGFLRRGASDIDGVPLSFLGWWRRRKQCRRCTRRRGLSLSCSSRPRPDGCGIDRRLVGRREHMRCRWGDGGRGRCVFDDDNLTQPTCAVDFLYFAVGNSVLVGPLALARGDWRGVHGGGMGVGSRAVERVLR